VSVQITALTLMVRDPMAGIKLKLAGNSNHQSQGS
jgi:hypothetical protein